MAAPSGEISEDRAIELLDLFRGPGVELSIGQKILIGEEGQNRRKWTLSQAWLSQHSGLFKSTFAASSANTQFILDTDPDIFRLFVEFMIRGDYITWGDETLDGICESAKAWVLGEHLDASGFQDLAMAKLYEVFKPEDDEYILSGVSPDAIRFICDNCTPDSALYRFFMAVTSTHWSNHTVVWHPSNARGLEDSWDNIFNDYPEFRDQLLTSLSQPGSLIQGLDAYLSTENEIVQESDMSLTTNEGLNQHVEEQEGDTWGSVDESYLAMQASKPRKTADTPGESYYRQHVQDRAAAH